MTADYYPLSDVLAIASVHPFYTNAIYPPTQEELAWVIASVRASAKEIELSSFPLSVKDEL